MSKPGVGYIVHYVSYGTPKGEYKSQCRAAVVTEIPYKGDGTDRHGNMVHLCVLNPEGMFFNKDVSYDPGDVDEEVGYMPGSWHWPEGEPE